MLAVSRCVRQDRGMQVKECMSAPVRVARTVDRLDAAARAMWDGDCGFCPVVDAAGQLVGVLTDRDLCMAAYTQGRPLAEIPVGAAMARSVRACRPEDTLATVLQTMAQIQVHRLPVIDARGVVVGVVSLSDLLRTAVARPAALDASAVLRTLAVVTAPRQQAAGAAVAETPQGVVAEAVVAEAAVAVAAPAPAPTVVEPKVVARSVPAAPVGGKPPAPKPPAAKPASAAAKGKPRRTRG